MDERFLPGPMITDVAPHLLKENEWQEVINMRMTKVGAMESVERLHDSIGGTDIRAMAEFTEDKSGDRFILYQAAEELYRVDYDAGDGDGYENEAAAHLTLPSGVTIPSGVTCRFFFYRGVIRILGPVDAASADCPLWYGYIDRQILTDAYEKLDEDGFETDTESWAANGGAAVTSETVALTPVGSKCLQIDQDGNANGSARKSWTVPAGVKVRLRLSARRADDVSGLNGDLLIKVGSTAGGSEYGTIRRGEIALADGAQTNTDILIKDWADINYGDIFDTSKIVIGGAYRTVVDAVGFPGITLTLDASTTVGDGDHVYPDWRYLELEDFVTTGTTLHVEIIPGEGESNAIALVDHLQVWVQSPVTLKDWYLEKAHLDVINLTGTGSASPWGAELTDPVIRFPRISTVFDRAQYSLPYGGAEGSGLLTNMKDAGYAVTNGIGVKLRLGGANLKVAANFPNKRKTGFIYAEGTEPVDSTKIEEELTFYSKIYMDFMEDQTPYKYARSGDHKKFYHYNATPCRLYMTNDPLDETVLGDNYLVAGRKVTFHQITSGVSQGSAVVVVTGFDSVKALYYIDFSTPVRRFFGELQNVASAYVETVVEVERITEYNASTGYDFLVVFDTTDQSTEFFAMTGIPAGTETLNCKGSWVDFIQERAFMVSEEDGEEDQLRYSPPYQPDSFPNTYKTPNKTGDADRNRVVLNIGDRIVLLKENTIAQVQFSGGSFYLDIALAKRGIYPILGFLVLDGVLYFMDKDDVYRFHGGTPEPVISKAGLRSYYRTYVDEDSFIVYDRSRKEIWFVLDPQHILVWQIEFENWFVRECESTLLGGFTDYDGNLIVFAETKSMTTGSRTDDDEYIRLYLKGREIGKNNPTKLKKVLRSLIDGYSEGGYLRMISDGVIENSHALTITETAITKDDFEAGTWAGWVGTDATLTAEIDDTPEARKHLKVASTVNAGYAKRTFTVTNGAVFKLRLLYLLGTYGKVRVGTPADDDYYGEFTQSGIYWNLASVMAVAANASVVVTVIPHTTSTGNALIDAVQCVVEDTTPGFQEFDEGAMFHKLYPEIIGANSNQKNMNFNSLTLSVKDWNLARKTG